MKRIYCLVLLISTIMLFSMSSCTKNDLTPSVNNNFTNTAPAPYTIDLIASHWNEIATGVYICTFPYIIPPGYRNNREVKIYLLKDDQTIQINYPILFMGGELSATTTPTDVTLNFRHYGELPFDYFKVNVVIE